jgi:hypothetical protein
MIPLGKAEIRWSTGGTLNVEIASEIQIPMAEVLKAWKDYPESFIPADPRDPNPIQLYAIRIPLGELRLGFTDFKEGYTLRSFTVSEFPIVRWGESESS